MSTNEYARQRGREAREPAATPAHEVRIAAPLTTAEQARIASRRDLLREHMPEALPFIKELHELGMIDGWRNVEDVTVFATPDIGSRA